MSHNEKIIFRLPEEYLAKILGFAIHRTRNREDAEDLAQEIYLQVLTALASPREIQNLNAFIWAVSHNTYCRWVSNQKRGTTTVLQGTEEAPDRIEDFYAQKEERVRLRQEITLLSKTYRDVIIMHYFSGMSCQQIANHVGAPVGTVKWWLHEARKDIKEGMDKMREYGERSYKPGKLHIGTQGRMGINGEPSSLVRHMFHQNILLAAYQKPRTIKELSLELGVSAPYVEDAVEFLRQNQVLVAREKETYQTDFIIMSQTQLAKIVNELDQAFGDVYYERNMSFLNQHREFLENSEYSKAADFNWSRLLWVYIFVFEDFCYDIFNHNILTKKMPRQELPIRPNGGKWVALGFEHGDEEAYRKVRKAEYGWDGPFTTGTKKNGESGYVKNLAQYWSGLDNEWLAKIPYQAIPVYIKVIKNNMQVDTLTDNEKELLITGIDNGFFSKSTAGLLKPNILYLPPEMYYKMKEQAKDLYGDLEEVYVQALDFLVKRLADLVPDHVRCQSGNCFSILFRYFATFCLARAKASSLLSEPEDEYKHLLSLYAYE